MESLDNDLKETLQELSDFSKSYINFIEERNVLQNKITVLEESLKLALDSEEKMRSKLHLKEENIAQLQTILDGCIDIKDENSKLKTEVRKLQDVLDEEKKNNFLEKEKWTQEKDNILKQNREEIENMKKIRNMEVSSLNREISHLQEENERKIESLRRNLENEFKDHMSQTVISYEDKLTNLGRDLVSAQSELRNLRQANNENSRMFNVADLNPSKERYIPQPLSFARYRPIVPIFSSASQICKDNEPATFQDSGNTSPPLKKKKKLYTRIDDIV